MQLHKILAVLAKVIVINQYAIGSESINLKNGNLVNIYNVEHQVYLCRNNDGTFFASKNQDLTQCHWGQTLKGSGEDYTQMTFSNPENTSQTLGVHVEEKTLPDQRLRLISAVHTMQESNLWKFYSGTSHPVYQTSGVFEISVSSFSGGNLYLVYTGPLSSQPFMALDKLEISAAHTSPDKMIFEIKPYTAPKI